MSKLYAKFLGENGYDSELERAMKILEVDCMYPVESIDIGGSSSKVYFYGFKDDYNSVMFEFYDEEFNEINIYKNGRGYYEYNCV